MAVVWIVVVVASTAWLAVRVVYEKEKLACLTDPMMAGSLLPLGLVHIDPKYEMKKKNI